MNLGRKKSQRGVSMVEVLVALTVLAIAMAASNAYFGKVAKTKRKSRLRDVQKRIGAVIKNSLKSPSDIYYSVSRHGRNPRLAACVLGVPVPSNPSLDCSDAIKIVGSNTQHTFGLYKVTDSTGTSGKAISNPEVGDEVYYDINGKRCARDDEKCAFSAETDFYVSCNKAVDSNCENGATQVFFSYQVKQISGTFSLLGKTLPPYPKVRRYTSMSTTQIIGPQKNSECGSGRQDFENFDPADRGSFSSDFAEGYYATLVGYDEYGKAICECIYPFVRIGEERDPATGLTVPLCRILTSEELACGEDEFLRGVKDVDNEEGVGQKEVICAREDQAFTCEPKTPYEACPTTHWISRVTSTDCDFTCHYKGDEVRTCEFSWDHYGGNFDLKPDVENEPLGQGHFACLTRQMYCCQPNWQGSGR